MTRREMRLTAEEVMKLRELELEETRLKLDLADVCLGRQEFLFELEKKYDLLAKDVEVDVQTGKVTVQDAG